MKREGMEGDESEWNVALLCSLSIKLLKKMVVKVLSREG